MSFDAAEPAARPRSRAARQAQTRSALVEAAFRVFASDGFGRASVETIAAEAGYSKGAVYSNFDGKADLFLAVMDAQLSQLETWDPFARGDAAEPVSHALTAEDWFTLPGELGASIGFGLATLEFVAAAGRDPDLRDALRGRVAMLVDAYGRMAADRRAPDDPLDDTTLGTLLTAFDQGSGLLILGGWDSPDDDLVRRGLLRLLHPAPEELDGAGG